MQAADQSRDQISNRRELTWVCFELAGQGYAVAAKHVQCVTAMAELHRPPTAPRMLRGFLNVAGEPVPVLCLHSLFELGPPPAEMWTPLVIMRDPRLAFAANAVQRIVVMDRAAISPLPDNHVFNACVMAVARIDDRSLLVISPERLLLQKESRLLADLADQARRRLSELEGLPA